MLTQALCLDELGIEGDRHLFSHHDAAGLECRIPRQPKILALDACRRSDPDSSVAPGVLHRSARPLDFKYNIPSHTMDRKVALNRKLIDPRLRDASRFEGQYGELLHVKEVGALEMRVALRLPRVNRGSIDRCLDF